MSILREIVMSKMEEVKRRKCIHTIQYFETTPNFQRIGLSLKEHLLNPENLGIIAEFKRKSPSKGVINANAKLENIVKGYEASGASAISILTESEYFAGSDIDLKEAKRLTNIPILRKDFVVDIFQIAEAKAIGADAILLIAEILEKEQLNDYLSYAHSIGLEALIEVHTEKDLEKLPMQAQMVGINSRNLNTFNVNLSHATDMLSKLPKSVVTIAESGISSIDDYLALRRAGFNAFLIGELFMKQPQPEVACNQFISSIRKELHNTDNEVLY
jgi:indole-3-glycerol phosphate synthase